MHCRGVVCVLCLLENNRVRRFGPVADATTQDGRTPVKIRSILFGLIGICLFGGGTAAAGLATDWSVGHKSKARLIVGAMPANDGGKVLYAGVEIKLAPDWKTYWRHPGDAGGVPPYLNWSKSENLGKAEIEFPVPLRFKDATGDAIGYKKEVVFPIRIRAAEAGRPLGLALDFQYGVCREICIPAQARLALMINPEEVRSMPPQLAEAIARVPVAADAKGASHPRLAKMQARLDGAQPEIIFDVAYPGDSAGDVDLFLEAEGEAYLPMTRRIAVSQPGVVRFRVDLGDGVDVKQLRGRKLRLTLATATGGREAIARLPD